MGVKHDVISFDKSRVWFEISNNEKICKKKTERKEVESLIQASQFLKGKKLNFLDKKYNILTPNILSWNEEKGILTMTFCEGENLESIICENKNREFGVGILQQMMLFIIKEKFFWRDFAPRNIIVNGCNIYIMDFEKGIGDKETTLKDFLRLRVYREYSSFLLPEERGIDIDKVFDVGKNEENKTIDVNTCSRRIIILAKSMGYYPYMSNEQNQDMRKRVILAEQPYINNGNIIYPRIEIERLLESKEDVAYEQYAEFILKNKKEIDCQER